jgi:glutamine cyclotransferase
MKKDIKNKIIQIGLFLFTIVMVTSCAEKTNKNITSNFYQFNKKIFHFGDTLQINTSSKHNIDSIVLKIGNKRITDPQNIVLDSSDFKYGENRIVQQVYFTKNDKKRNIKYKGVFSIHPSVAEKNIEYEIINEYDHQVSNFTQGLVISDDGYMIESTGEYGSSELLKYKLGDDSYSEQIRLSGKYFGEGATILNGKIYQLTWQNRKGLIYDEGSFEKTGAFSYPKQITQGWGLTTNRKELILSDGSSNLYFLEEANLSKINRKVEVLGHENIYTYLNELEFENQYIYANILESDIIIKINARNGVVVGKIDLKELSKAYRRYGVLNGIAYNPKNDSFIITGKNWPKMFEIKLIE